MTFAALGEEAVLLTALGQGTIAETITAELRGQGVETFGRSFSDRPVFSTRLTRAGSIFSCERIESLSSIRWTRHS